MNQFYLIRFKRTFTSRNAKYQNIEHLQISFTIPNMRNLFCLITQDSINLKVMPILLSKSFWSLSMFLYCALIMLSASGLSLGLTLHISVCQGTTKNSNVRNTKFNFLILCDTYITGVLHVLNWFSSISPWKNESSSDHHIWWSVNHQKYHITVANWFSIS